MEREQRNPGARHNSSDTKTRRSQREERIESLIGMLSQLSMLFFQETSELPVAARESSGSVLAGLPKAGCAPTVERKVG